MHFQAKEPPLAQEGEAATETNNETTLRRVGAGELLQVRAPLRGFVIKGALFTRYLYTPKEWWAADRDRFENCADYQGPIPN